MTSDIFKDYMKKLNIKMTRREGATADNSLDDLPEADSAHDLVISDIMAMQDIVALQAYSHATARATCMLTCQQLLI